MRHRKANVKLGRTASHRKAMLKNLATSLFEHKHIVTTIGKAKALRPLLDKLVNLAKKGDLNSYRRGLAMVTRRKVLKQLFADAKAGEVGSDRESGYFSMARIGLRAGDAAILVRLSLIPKDYNKPVSGTKKVGSLDRSRRVAASKAKSQPAPAESADGE
jgi:large subunit ribosomal protein L17